jgi:hypothetical protein
LLLETRIDNMIIGMDGMNGSGHRALSIDVPSAAVAGQRERDAHLLFRRALTGWASDALSLRRIQRDRFAWTDEDAREACWPVAA